MRPQHWTELLVACASRSFVPAARTTLVGLSVLVAVPTNEHDTDPLGDLLWPLIVTGVACTLIALGLERLARRERDRVPPV
jgi:hypothetical protein